MNIATPEEPPPAYTRGDATFAQVAKDLYWLTGPSPEFRDTLAAFKHFLDNQEKDRLSKHQLKLLRSQVVYALEECAKFKHAGGDLSTLLPVITEIFKGVSAELEQGPRWDQAITDPSVIRKLESTIGDAVDCLEDQMHKMAQGEDAETTIFKDELERARENDRNKIEELVTVIRELQNSANQSPNEAIQSSIEENLKIISDRSASVGQKQIDARKSLAVIAELTGKSLPPNTILDRNFVRIGPHAISQGSSYDVFIGEYFTGEKIAIKVLRHRVDEETARRTLERFARLTENWSALRHDCILSFYGVGVEQSPVSPTEYQLYLVSPYLKNQDVKRYIKTYPTVSRLTRLQMALDIAHGLKYMHGGGDLAELEGKGMVHSSLNIYNVLVKDSERVVISGFGHAKVIKDFQASFTGDNSEYRYMGPEILDDAVLTFGSDIWSWAMTSLEILTDEPPFGAKTRGTKIIQMIGTDKRPNRKNHPKIEDYEFSDEIWQLFEDCWKRQPEERPTAREVVRRFRSFALDLGKMNDPNIQDPPEPSYPRTDYGRSHPAVEQGTQPQPEQHQLGRASKPIAQSQPPPSSSGGTGGIGNQGGKAIQPIVPAPDPSGSGTVPPWEQPDRKPTTPVAQGQLPSSATFPGTEYGREFNKQSNPKPRQGAMDPGRLSPVIIREPTYSRGEATFAHISSELSSSVEIGLDFGDALQAFRLFLEVEENATIGKGQLKILRAQAVYVLEECAWYRREGGDLSQVLPVFTQILFEVSEQIKLKARWDAFVKDSLGISEVEVEIGKAFRKLVEQLQQLTRGKRTDPLLYDADLDEARENDRKKVELIKSATRDKQYSGPSFRNLDTGVKPLIDHCLGLMAMASVHPTDEKEQQIADPKRTLAAIAELAGQSAPLATLVDERFIGIRPISISQSATYDVFVGEYFTGQEVAIKLTKYQADKETTNAAHSRFSQLRENWTSLRHDCIHPLYGLGIMQSVIHPTKYRIYSVSPYLRNQDAGTYLRMYPMTSESSRLQMVLDVAQGLKYMHSEYILPDGQGVAHCALNIHNILVKDSGRATISGFGLVDILEHVSIKDPNFEPYRYMGPEFLNDVMPSRSFGSDIWSWAMTSLEILTNEPPFGHDITGARIIQEILAKPLERGKYPKIEDYEHKDEIWNLLEDCWKTRPEDRPSALVVVGRLKPLVNKSITRHMSAAEILRLLSENGYTNITAKIDFKRCSSAAVRHGGTGDIYQGYLFDSSKVAIKCPRHFDTSEDEDRDSLKGIAMEGYQWLKHQHENVLEIFGLALFRNQIALVSPWMENGTALNYVKKHPGVNRINVCSQVARGLAYLHNKGTIHGDLKAVNVLVSQIGIAKIIDFGSTVMNRYSFRFSGRENTRHMTMRWAAPEILQDSDTPVSSASDVYALGMTIFEIVTGKLPFEHIKQDVGVCPAIFRGERPRRPIDYIPISSRDGDQLWGLLESCWKHNPGDRPTALEVELALSELTQEGPSAVEED